MTIEGTWYNELGSTVIFKENGASLTGIYITAVGGATGSYELVGRIDTDDDTNNTAVGWVVVWNNSHGSSDSVTAWSGQLQVEDGVQQIDTTWLLTSETDPENDWRSTLVGKDIFTREKPSDESIAAACKGRRLSNPS